MFEAEKAKLLFPKPYNRDNGAKASPRYHTSLELGGGVVNLVKVQHFNTSLERPSHKMHFCGPALTAWWRDLTADNLSHVFLATTK